MSKILVTTFGTTGDILSCLRLANELATRNHKITVALNPGQIHLAQPWGFPAIAIGKYIDPKTWASAYENGTSENLNTAKTVAALVDKIYAPAITSTYNHFLSLVSDYDFVLANPLALWAAPACQHYRLPYAVLHMMAIGIPSSSYPPVRFPKPRFLKALYNLTAWQLTRLTLWLVYTKPLMPAYRKVGLEAPQHIFLDDSLSPYMNLVALDPLWYAPGLDWSPSIVETGFIRPHAAEERSVPEEVVKFVQESDNAPLLVFAFGSMLHLGTQISYQPFVDVARRHGCRVLIVEGWGGASLVSGEGVLSVPYVPYKWLFDRVSVVVHHGGTGTVADCLWSSVPQLVVAHGFDQPDNGIRVEGLGVGRWMHLRHFTPARFDKVLGEMLPNLSTYKQAAMQVEKQLIRDGVGRAADAVERCLPPVEKVS
jgi:UDP:flavonoid glycosyltransferase YjiC (YdhE family)